MTMKEELTSRIISRGMQFEIMDQFDHDEKAKELSLLLLEILVERKDFTMKKKELSYQGRRRRFPGQTLLHAVFNCSFDFLQLEEDTESRSESIECGRGVIRRFQSPLLWTVGKSTAARMSIRSILKRRREIALKVIDIGGRDVILEKDDEGKMHFIVRAT